MLPNPETCFRYYSTPWVANAIVRQCRLKYTTVRYPNALLRHYRRPINEDIASNMWLPVTKSGNPFFEIHRVGDDPRDMLSFRHFVESGAVEFIPATSRVYDLDRASTVCVDLDPKVDIDLHVQKEILIAVYRCLSPGTFFAAKRGLVGCEFRHSGNRSFHVWLHLQRPSNLAGLKADIKEALTPFVNTNKGFTFDNQENATLLLDCGSLARNRCTRSLWSLHWKTSRVCVPVPDIKAFRVEDTEIEEVHRRWAPK